MADGPEEGGGADVPHGDRHYTGLARIESLHRPIDIGFESRIDATSDEINRKIVNIDPSVDRLSSGIDRLNAGVDSGIDILSQQSMGIASGLDLALSGFGDREKSIGIVPGIESGADRDRQMGVSTEIDREKTMMRGEDVIMKQENDESATCLDQQMMPINLKSEAGENVYERRENQSEADWQNSSLGASCNSESDRSSDHSSASPEPISNANNIGSLLSGATSSIYQRSISNQQKSPTAIQEENNHFSSEKRLNNNTSPIIGRRSPLNQLNLGALDSKNLGLPTRDLVNNNGSLVGHHLNGTVASMLGLQNLPPLGAPSPVTSQMSSRLSCTPSLGAPLNLSVGNQQQGLFRGLTSSPSPVNINVQGAVPAPMPQLILASGQMVQGIQGAQLLIPTSQGLATQTILTIPVSHVNTNDQMVNLALSSGQVITASLAELQAMAESTRQMQQTSSDEQLARVRQLLDVFRKQQQLRERLDRDGKNSRSDHVENMAIDQHGKSSIEHQHEKLMEQQMEQHQQKLLIEQHQQKLMMEQHQQKLMMEQHQQKLMEQRLLEAGERERRSEKTVRQHMSMAAHRYPPMSSESVQNGLSVSNTTLSPTIPRLNGELTITPANTNNTSSLANSLGGSAMNSSGIGSSNLSANLLGGLPSILQQSQDHLMNLKRSPMSTHSEQDDENDLLMEDCGNQPTINQTNCNTVDGINLDEIKEFAKAFKLRRLSLGLTQTQVGQALSVTEGPAYSQSAICSALAAQMFCAAQLSTQHQNMFEKLDITPKSAQKIKPVLERWMKEAEERYKSGQNHLTDFIGVEPSKKRKRRTSFTPQALELLNAHFERNTHPSGTEITGLAHQLGYEREVIRIWFCNKRQALKNTVRMMSKSMV